MPSMSCPVDHWQTAERCKTTCTQIVATTTPPQRLQWCLPDCHRVTQNGGGSSSVTSPAFVLVETTKESMCGGGQGQERVGCHMSRKPGVTPPPAHSPAIKNPLQSSCSFHFPPSDRYREDFRTRDYCATTLGDK